MSELTLCICVIVFVLDYRNHQLPFISKQETINPLPPFPYVKCYMLLQIYFFHILFNIFHPSHLWAPWTYIFFSILKLCIAFRTTSHMPTGITLQLKQLWQSVSCPPCYRGNVAVLESSTSKGH